MPIGAISGMIDLGKVAWNAAHGDFDKAGAGLNEIWKDRTEIFSSDGISKAWSSFKEKFTFSYYRKQADEAATKYAHGDAWGGGEQFGQASFDAVDTALTVGTVTYGAARLGMSLAGSALRGGRALLSRAGRRLTEGQAVVGAAGSRGGRLALKKVNPHRGRGGRYNCIQCAIANDARLAGYDAVALRSAKPTNMIKVESSLRQYFGQALEAEHAFSPQGLRGQLPNRFGAQAIITAHYNSGEVGHVFNAFNRKGKWYFQDVQTGKTGLMANAAGFDSFRIYITR